MGRAGAVCHGRVGGGSPRELPPARPPVWVMRAAIPAAQATLAARGSYGKLLRDPCFAHVPRTLPLPEECTGRRVSLGGLSASGRGMGVAVHRVWLPGDRWRGAVAGHAAARPGHIADQATATRCRLLARMNFQPMLASDRTFGDDRLKLMFACTHPAIAADAQAAADAADGPGPRCRADRRKLFWSRPPRWVSGWSAPSAASAMPESPSRSLRLKIFPSGLSAGVVRDLRGLRHGLG